MNNETDLLIASLLADEFNRLHNQLPSMSGLRNLENHASFDATLDYAPDEHEPDSFDLE